MFMTVAEAHRRILRIRDEIIPQTARESANNNQDVLLDLNRDQFLYGRDAEGEVLTPSYSQDPYFETPEAALSYKRKKEAYEAIHKGMRWNTAVGFPEKDSDTPNLIITGTLFMDYLFINIASDTYEVGSTGIAAPDIERKYGKIYGLAPLSKEYFWFGFMRPDIMNKIRQLLPVK